MTEELAVTIVAYSSDEVIGDCLRAARLIRGVAEVVVVDHGDGRSAALASRLGAAAVHDGANPGFGAGHNRAIAATHAPFLLLLNPDAQVVPEAIAHGLAILQARPSVGAVQGVIRNGQGLPERSQGRRLGPRHLMGRAVGARRLLRFRPVQALVRLAPGLGDHVDRIPVGVTRVQSLAATALLVRRAAFEAAGGFDEGFFLYGEDVDLCIRMQRAGFELVALPSTWALHLSGASSATPLARELHWWRGSMRLAAKWWSPVAWFTAVSAAVMQSAVLIARQPRCAASILSALVLGPLADRRALRSAQRGQTREPRVGFTRWPWNERDLDPKSSAR